jgi:hypothetical protein
MIIWDKQASNEEKARAIEEALLEAEIENKEEEEAGKREEKEKKRKEEDSFLRNEFGLGQ